MKLSEGSELWVLSQALLNSSNNGKKREENHPQHKMCRRKQQGSLPNKGSHGLLRSSQCSSSGTRLLQKLGYPKRLLPQGRTPSSIPSWCCWRGLSATPPSTSLTNTVVLQSPSLSSTSSLLNLVTSAKALGEFWGWTDTCSHTPEAL